MGLLGVKPAGRLTENASAAAEILAAVDAAGAAAPAPEAEVVVAPAVAPPVVVAAPAAVDPMRAIVARLIALHPARAAEIARGVTAVGGPVVSRAAGRVLSTHQKYRLADGTILPLEV